MTLHDAARRYCVAYWRAIESDRRDMCGQPMHRSEMHEAHEQMMQIFIQEERGEETERREDRAPNAKAT